MHKSATKCNKTIGKWCKNKHGASKIIGTLETYHIGQAKGHHGVFKQTVAGGKGGLRNIRLTNFQLMISSTEINLGEYLGPIQLIK
jgi:hypothetical protein